MISTFAVPVAGRAEAPSFGISFNDTVIFDSQHGYQAGDIKRDFQAGTYQGQPFVTDGKARASFGTLGISTLVASRNNGVFQPIVRLDELVKAYSYDVFQIRSDSLAVGTPVTLTFTSAVHIAPFGALSGPFASLYPCLTNSSADCFPSGTVFENNIGSDLFGGIAFDFNDVFDYANCSQFVLNGCTGPQLTVGNNVLTFRKAARVGDNLALRIRFEAIASQYHPFNATGFSGSAFFGLNTAYTSLNISSPSVTATAISGHSYAAALVPEPTTWGLMIVGFGLVGAAVRRRRFVSVTYA